MEIMEAFFYWVSATDILFIRREIELLIFKALYLPLFVE